jgi:two-component system, LytTR family, sensor kinase
MKKTFQYPKWYLKFIVVLIFHFLIKIGDTSMDVFHDITLRGSVFTLFFVSFWFSVWIFASKVNNSMIKRFDSNENNRFIWSVFMFSVHFCIGLSAGFLANYLYRIGDIYIFNSYELYKTVTVFNPELTLSLFSFYMMIFAFDAFFYSRVRQIKNQLDIERLNQEITMSKYLNLKSQIEPHFLFNSLSVLSSLINTNTKLATEFTLKLSKILRYVVTENEGFIVTLQQELDFVDNYLFLMKTRFEDSIFFVNKIDDELIKDVFVPPTSIQLLIENAIKHNVFSEEQPIYIELSMENNFLLVYNAVSLKKDSEMSTKQGLKNLVNRYTFFTEKEVQIIATETNFKVYLPVLHKLDYESINH